LLPEATNVVPELLRQIHLAAPLLDVRPIQPPDVVLVEDRRHRLDLPQEVGDRLDVARLQHARLDRTLVRIIRDRVPRAEDQILERRQRHEVLDLRLPALRPLPQPDVTHLRQGADRLPQPATNQLDTCDERRSNRAQTRREDPEPTGRRRDLTTLLHSLPRSLKSRQIPTRPAARPPRACTPTRFAGRP